MICGIAGGSITFVISTVCYIIALSVGWSLAKDIHPDDNLLDTAATVITVPLYGLVGIIVLYAHSIACAVAWSCTSKEKEEAETAIQGCTAVTLVIFEILAGFFEVTGAVIFIIAAVYIGDHRVLAFGISAGVFGILAGCSCCLCECFTIIGIAASLCNEEF